MHTCRQPAGQLARRATHGLRRQRAQVLVPGNVKQVRQLARGARGWGWFKLFKEKGNDGFRKAHPPTPFDWEADAEGERKKAFLELTVDGVAAGRLELELANDLLPITCENFVRLCKGTGPFTYKGTAIHRVVKGTGLMAGDVEGKGGQSSHSALGQRYFADEAYIIPHADEGLITMANSGVHTNGSQFYITTGTAPHLDGRCVAFGRVVKGMDVVKSLDGVFTVRMRPASDVIIADCGLVE